MSYMSDKHMNLSSGDPTQRDAQGTFRHTSFTRLLLSTFFSFIRNSTTSTSPMTSYAGLTIWSGSAVPYADKLCYTFTSFTRWYPLRRAGSLIFNVHSPPEVRQQRYRPVFVDQPFVHVPPDSCGKIGSWMMMQSAAGSQAAVPKKESGVV
jgi:hypothetical protein